MQVDAALGPVAAWHPLRMRSAALWGACLRGQGRVHDAVNCLRAALRAAAGCRAETERLLYELAVRVSLHHRLLCWGGGV